MYDELIFDNFCLNNFFALSHHFSYDEHITQKL